MVYITFILMKKVMIEPMRSLLCLGYIIKQFTSLQNVYSLRHQYRISKKGGKCTNILKTWFKTKMQTSDSYIYMKYYWGHPPSTRMDRRKEHGILKKVHYFLFLSLLYYIFLDCNRLKCCFIQEMNSKLWTIFFKLKYKYQRCFALS